MEAFEASGSIANTATGLRREGAEFEALIAAVWDQLASMAREKGARAGLVRSRGRSYAQLLIGARALYVPVAASHRLPPVAESPPRWWLERRFEISDLVASFPGEREAVLRYAPARGPYASERYPGIYAGLTTTFDETVVLVENGVLREKLLLEYKTAKSTSGRQLDGNAHERLSFQIMQYLEVATRYTRCSLAVIANGAFAKYRSKYHVSFHVQADRLANFAWFRMDHMSTAVEYERFMHGLTNWLFTGTPRQVAET
jgi:hypothetical protein